MLPLYGSRTSSREEERSLKRVFRIGKVIGQGAYAKVRKMTRKSDGLHFALKTVNKDKIPPELKQVHNAWMYEARLLLEMDHPHIVKMETVFETPKKIMMVMEYLSTDLHEALEKRSESGDQIATADACTIIYRLADALKYLHAQGVVHRDLKPENILVSGRDPTDIKLADFGTAGRIGPGREQLHTKCGSLSYVAPEVLKQQPYGCEVDIWSLGVIIYRMLSDSLPFSDPNAAVKLRKVVNGQYSFPSDKWDRIDPGGTGPIDLIKRCLEVDPAVRITASEILKHPWVSQHYKPLQRLPPSPPTDMPATPWLQSASPIRQLRDPQLLPQIPEIILDGGSGDTTPSFTTPSHNVRNLLSLDPAAASAQAYPSVLSLLLSCDKTLVIDKIVLVRDQLLATSDSDETEQDQELRQLSYSASSSLSHQCRSAPSRTRSLSIDPSISIEREDDADDDEEDEDEKEEEKETSETKEDCSDSESRSRTSKMHERRTSKMHTRLDSPPRVVCKRASSEPGPDGPDHFSTPWSRDELDIRLKNNDRLVAGHATLHCVTPAAPSSPAASSRVMSERVSLCIPKDGVQHHKALSPARSFKNVTQKQRRHSIQPISFSQLSPTLSLSKLNLLQPSPRTSSNSLSQPLRTFAFGKPNKTQPSRGRPISYSPFSDSTRRSIVPMPPSPLPSLSRAVAAPLSHSPTSSLPRRSIDLISHSPFAVSPRSLEPSSQSPVSSTPRSLGFNGVSHSHSLPSATRRILEPPRPSRQGLDSVPSLEIVEEGRKEVESQSHQNKRKVYSPMRESGPKPATKRQETTRRAVKGYARERSSGMRRSSLSPFPMPVKNPNAPPKDMFWLHVLLLRPCLGAKVFAF
eukprot:g4647.t1